MNANGQDPNKGRRVKIIVATVIAGMLIILVGFWAISSAINSGKKTADSNSKTTEVAKTTEKEKTESNGTKPTSPSSQYTSTTQTQTPAPAPAVTTESPIPTTGPSEVVFSAIMLGIVTSLVVLNVQLAKSRE